MKAQTKKIKVYCPKCKGGKHLKTDGDRIITCTYCAGRGWVYKLNKND